LLAGTPGRILRFAAGVQPDGHLAPMNPMKKLLRADEGATAVEYAVVLALILMVIITAVASVGVSASGMWNTVLTQLKAFGI